MITNTFELERNDSGVALWVWETWHGSTRLGSSLDLSISEALELAELLVEYANKTAPTEHAVETAEFEADLKRDPCMTT